MEARAILVPRFRFDCFEIIAREVSGYRTRFEAIETRLAAVETVNAQLEEAALTTARAWGRDFRELGPGL
jgi:hypothetical protein